MIARTNELVLFLLASVVFLATTEVGYRLGLRQRDRQDEESRKHIGALQAALLGLLALLLGFNFAMASSRYDTRRTLLQEEVNAIGTAYLRVRILPPSVASAFVSGLTNYLNTRIQFMQAGVDEEKIRVAEANSVRIETELWKLMQNPDSKDTSGVHFGLIFQSLNEVISARWKRHNALQNHVPEPAIHLLFTVAVGAIGFIAYGYGLTGRRRHLSTAFFSILIAVVLSAILDFDRPRGGLIQINESALQRLQQDLSQFPP